MYGGPQYHAKTRNEETTTGVQHTQAIVSVLRKGPSPIERLVKVKRELAYVTDVQCVWCGSKGNLRSKPGGGISVSPYYQVENLPNISTSSPAPTSSKFRG